MCLCAGAVNTPQILMLSGIGPQEHLEDVGIECAVNLPGVGENLRDHLHVPMCYRVESGVKPHSRSNICEGSLFAKLNPDATSPDLQVHIGVLFFDPEVFTPLGEGFTLTPSLIHPKSRGSVRLRSKDVFERPLIQANYLTEKEDLDTLVKGVKLVREIGLEMLDTVNGEEGRPGPSIQSDMISRSTLSIMSVPCTTLLVRVESDVMTIRVLCWIFDFTYVVLKIFVWQMHLLCPNYRCEHECHVLHWWLGFFVDCGGGEKLSVSASNNNKHVFFHHYYIYTHAPPIVICGRSRSAIRPWWSTASPSFKTPVPRSSVRFSPTAGFFLQNFNFNRHSPKILSDNTHSSLEFIRRIHTKKKLHKYKQNESYRNTIGYYGDKFYES